MIKLTNNSNPRRDKLITAILDIIHHYPGIVKNEIKEKLRAKGMSSISTIDKEIDELLNMGIIEYRAGNRAHHHFIKGYEKLISHDNILANLISDLKERIDIIEKTSPDYDQYTKNLLYHNLKDKINTFDRIYENYKEKKQDLEHPGQEEDGLIEFIREFSHYKIKGLCDDIDNAEQTYKEIKNLRKIELDELQSNTKKKSWSKIIKILTDIKSKLKELQELPQHLNEVRSGCQRNFFDKTLRENQNSTEIIAMLRSLNKVMQSIPRNTIEYKNLYKIKHHLYKELKPMKKNVIIKKLLDSGRFTRNDIDNILNEYHRNMKINIDTNKIYSLIY